MLQCVLTNTMIHINDKVTVEGIITKKAKIISKLNVVNCNKYYYSLHLHAVTALAVT